jgi:hypothetical protein
MISFSFVRNKKFLLWGGLGVAVVCLFLLGFFFWKSFVSEKEEKTLDHSFQTGKTYTTSDFAIGVPGDWEVLDSFPGTYFLMKSLVGDGSPFSPALVITKVQNAFNFSDAILQAQNKILKMSPDASFQNELKEKTSPFSFEYESTRDGELLRFLVLVIQGKRDDVWVLTFSSSKKSWKEFLPVFNKVKESFIVY